MRKAAAFAVGASFSTVGLVLLGVILTARGTSVTSRGAAAADDVG